MSRVARKKNPPLPGSGGCDSGHDNLTAGTSALAEGSPPLRDAVAVWHFRDLNDSAGANSALKPHGTITVGKPLEDPEKAMSLANGGDARAADCAGGYLVPGQGADGELALAGSSFSMYARLRNPSGDWTSCGIVSKHGGHENLVYNLYGNAGKLGFELGTARGLFRVDVPAHLIGATDWHDVIVRYDGNKLELYADGIRVASQPASGDLRSGNVEPLVLAGYSVGGSLRGPFKGQLDTVALWKRTLSDAEIIVLSGGQDAVSKRKVALEKRLEEIKAAKYAELPEPVAAYRKVVRSTDVEAYSKAASALRKWMIKNDPHRPVVYLGRMRCALKSWSTTSPTATNLRRTMFRFPLRSRWLTARGSPNIDWCVSVSKAKKSTMNSGRPAISCSYWMCPAR